MPSVTHPENVKVQLSFGKTVEVDDINMYYLGGKIVEESIPDLGFKRYVLPSLGPLAGTLMSIDPSEPKVKKFLPILPGYHLLLRYNPRVPIVVYVPEGCEVHYKLWRADEEATKAEILPS